jgi:hypothetical protein
MAVVSLVVTPSLVSGVSVAQDAVPQPAYRPGDIERRFLVGLESGVLNVSSDFVADRTMNGSSERGSTHLALDLGGIPSLVFGYGLHRDWLLSGTLSAARRTVEAGNQEESTTQARVSPAISYLIGQGAVRPFVGVQGTFSVRKDDLEHLGVGGGAHAGIRWEAVERIALEPTLRASAFWSENHYDYGTLQGDVDATEVAASAALRVAAYF